MDDQAEADKQDACRLAIANGADFITAMGDLRKRAQMTGKELQNAIDKDRDSWRESRTIEDQNHALLVDLQSQRAEASEAIRARVDERNKAIDVLVKATFMVCERFNRYKNTEQASSNMVKGD